MKKSTFIVMTIFILSYSLRALCQIPMLYLAPVDTVDFSIDEIKSVELVHFNSDGVKDYYVKTDSTSYLYDGDSMALIWQSLPVTNPHNQNLQFIQGQQVWMNFVIEKTDNFSFKITWFGVPDNIPIDSILQSDCPNHARICPLLDAGYIDISTDQYIYANVSNTVYSGYSETEYGISYFYDFNSHSLIDTVRAGMPFTHQVFNSNSETYLWNVGFTYYDNLYPYDSYIIFTTIFTIFNSSLEEIVRYQIQENSQYTSTRFPTKAVLYVDTTTTSVQQLIAKADKLLLYQDIFAESSFVSYGECFSPNYADYIYYNDQQRIIAGSFSTYFEILDTQLLFDSYIIDNLPSGIIDTKAEDIDGDGNDEVFCIYPDKIIICELQDAVGIDDPAVLPRFAVSNYPNPFNATTAIHYDIPEQSQVTLEIYDILGRRIETLVNQTQPAGSYQAIWDASHAPSGVYFYHLTAGEYSEARKMLLIK